MGSNSGTVSESERRLKQKEHFDVTKMAELAVNHKSSPSPRLTCQPWYAVRVRSSAEVRVAAALQHRGYHPFLPTYIASKCYSDRIKKVTAA